MHERVKTTAIVLFLVVTGLVIYQVYSGDQGLFTSPATTPEGSLHPLQASTLPTTPSAWPTTSPSSAPLPTLAPLPLLTPLSVPEDPFIADLQTAGIVNARVEQVREEREIFTIQLDSIPEPIVKRYIYDGSTTFGVMYEAMNGVTYDQIQSAILDRIVASPVWSMNETNSYGEASFYLNNRNRSDTVFLLIKFPDRTLGFEYPKANHETFEKLYSLLGGEDDSIGNPLPSSPPSLGEG